MTTDQTITVTVKPEIDREAVEEAAQLAAALFLSSFAVAVLDGVTEEEPPEEVLARIKAATLEKAAQGGENAPLADAGHDQASYTGSAAADAPEAAQTLADLTPCLGDRVRVRNVGPASTDLVFRWHPAAGEFVWVFGHTWWVSDADAPAWTVLEHLDPVTPEEPPVGAGMLVDVSPLPRRDVIWNRDESGWRLWVDGAQKWSVPVTRAVLMDDGFRFRPATPADLAENGVDEQGESVGKGEPGEDVVRDLVNALRWTVEYVGTDVLPPMKGWSWYDALVEHAPDVAAAFAQKAGDRG